MHMNPPTVTAQEHKVTVRNGKPVFYNPSEVKEAKSKLLAYLSKHKPSEPYSGGLMLTVKWLFPKGKHHNGEYRTTKPDTDNLQKLLKDCMTECGFWKDDALVASEHVEKFWANTPGIYIEIKKLRDNDNVQHRADRRG
jgi:Holliday junction resolvase RusA-like endonuclease